MYRLMVDTHFSAAHHLRGYEGECEALHGHNWKVAVQVASETLDNLGMVVDFKVLKGALSEIIRRLDHTYLNDIPPFDTLNPSSENLACHIFQELSKSFSTAVIQVTQVTVWESEGSAAIYSE
jgi:6-pyruvoyltetrahydropterin/6-carboxytetrahydropterin synthase